MLTKQNLKRVTVSSPQELESWLAKAAAAHESAMLVTPTSGKDTISREQVEDVLAAHGWVSERRYTLGKRQLGHVISRNARKA